MPLNDQVELIPLFSIPVVKTSLDRDFTKKELQLFLTDIPMWKDEKLGMPNHRSKEKDLFDSHADTLKDIRKFCEYQLKRYIEEIEGVDVDIAGLRITQSWLNKTKPNESHHSHNHQNSYLSGVFYICCLPNDSINFTNRNKELYNNIEFPIKEITSWNPDAVKVGVKEGDLIIFPSWVLHYVDVNETKNRERISLSFDTFPIGKMGNSPATRLIL